MVGPRADHKATNACGKVEVSDEVFDFVAYEKKHRNRHASADWQSTWSIVKPPPKELFDRHLVEGLSHETARQLTLSRRELSSSVPDLRQNTVFEAPDHLVKFPKVSPGILVSPKPLDTLQVNVYENDQTEVTDLGPTMAIFHADPPHHFDDRVLDIRQPRESTFADLIERARNRRSQRGRGR